MNQLKPIVIDTHFHLDLFPQPEMLARQLQNQNIKAIAVTNAPSVFHYTYDLSQRYSVILPAIGLHPELALERQHELPIMWNWLNKTRFIGEIGLDYVTSDEENKNIQRAVFQSVLTKCAEYGNKIITVHSRRSSGDVIDTIGDRYPGRIILHWYSGGKRDLEKGISYGFYFSVNSAMLSAKKSRELIQHIPIERIVTETDGPFIKISSNPTTPLYIPEILRSLALLWNKSVETTRQQVSDNFNTLISSATD